MSADDGGRGLDHARFRNALPHSLAFTFVLILQVVAASNPASAQVAVKGVVLDPSKAVVVGASVELREIGQVVKRSILTGAGVAIGDAKLAEQYAGILGLLVSFLIDRDGRNPRQNMRETEVSVIEQELKSLL